jgi:predicted nucleotidyltransferase
MRQENPLDILSRHRDELRQFGVKSLTLFGSVVRGDDRPDSDVDMLVEFNRPTGVLAFLRLKYHLEAILGRKVDLVTSQALKRQLKDRILQEVSHAGQGLEI